MKVSVPLKSRIRDLPETAKIHCSLYDLMSALIDVGGPGEDFLIVSAVLDLMASGRVEWKQSPSKPGIKRTVQPESRNKNRSKRPENLYEMRA